MSHLIGDNEIRCGEVTVFFRLVENGNIHFLADLLVVHRAVPVWLNITPLFCPVVVIRQVFCKILIVCVVVAHGVPHFKECNGQRFDGVALKPYARVLPFAVRLFQVEISVGYVVTAGITDFAVNDGDFTVVAVVQKEIQARHKRVKYSALYTDRFQPVDKFHIDKAYRAHIVVENSDLDALFNFSFQNILYFFPIDFVLYGVIFHKDKLFGFFQILYLSVYAHFAVVVICDIGIFIHRVRGISDYIV